MLQSHLNNNNENNIFNTNFELIHFTFLKKLTEKIGTQAAWPQSAKLRAKNLSEVKDVQQERT